MGRDSTGANTTQECRKLDLRLMLKTGWIRKGYEGSGQMRWTDGSTAGIETKYAKDEKFIRLLYSITDRHGTKTDLNYKIEMITVPSNLGKGDVLYFVCPESGKRARVLYMAYRHHKYLHRDWYLEHYGLRLYYSSQKTSKDYYHNTMYHSIRKEIDTLENELNQKHRKKYYRGKPTHDLQKLHRLKDKMYYYDYKRNKIFMKRMGKMESRFKD